MGKDSGGAGACIGVGKLGGALDLMCDATCDCILAKIWRSVRPVAGCEVEVYCRSDSAAVTVSLLLNLRIEGIVILAALQELPPIEILA